MSNRVLSKKERIARGLEKGRVSNLIDVYTDALNDFDKMVREAFDQNDASKLPESLQKFLKKRGLKDTTYYGLQNKLPFADTRNVAELRSQLASSIINRANRQPKFITLNDLLKNANFTDKQYKVLSNDKRVLKLDTAAEKIARAYNGIFRAVNAGDKNIKEFFNPRELISKITGLSGETVSKNFDVEKYAGPEAAKLYKKLSNNKIQKIINNSKQDFTLDSFTKKMDSLGSQARAQATRKSRLEVAAKKAGEGVADINAAQDEAIALLNKFYKDNPQELLGNTKLRNLLDLTLKDGEIVKKNKYVTDEDFLKLIKNKTGLFTKDHVDEVQFEKLSTEFPVFKQLATYNTNSGLIKSIKAYVAKNQNNKDPVVQNKIKKQIEFLEDLKLRVDTPIGRVGSKEVLAAVDRQAGTLPNFLAQLRALNIKLPAKAKAILLGTGGGLAATTLAVAGPIDETEITPEIPIKYNDEIGAFVDPKTDDKVSQATLLDWAANNPMPTAAVASAPLLSKTVRKGAGKLLSGLLKTLGSPTAAAGFAGLTIKENLEEGKSIPDAVIDPLVGVELLFPELAKRAATSPTGTGLLSKAGRFLLNPIPRAAAAMTPLGVGITALGLGKMGIKAAIDEREKILGMTEQEKTDYLADQYESFGGVFGEGA